MHSPLVTLDGFPRNDIDVLAVRTARVRILELRNDCASPRWRLGLARLTDRSRRDCLPLALCSVERVMDQISLALQQAIPASSQPRAPAASTSSTNGVARAPYALVKSVDPAGPGAAAVRPHRLCCASPLVSGRCLTPVSLSPTGHPSGRPAACVRYRHRRQPQRPQGACRPGPAGRARRARVAARRADGERDDPGRPCSKGGLGWQGSHRVRLLRDKFLYLARAVCKSCLRRRLSADACDSSRSSLRRRMHIVPV